MLYRNLLILVFLICSQAYAQSFGDEKKYAIYTKLNIELRGDGKKSNIQGDFHPNILPAFSGAIGLDYQRNFSDKWFYSVGLNLSVHCNLVVSRRGLKSQFTDDYSFNAFDTHVNGIRLNAPVSIIRELYTNNRFTLNAKLGINSSLVVDRRGAASTVGYIFLGHKEEYIIRDIQPNIEHLFEYAPLLGFQFEFPRMIYELEASYSPKYRFKTSYYLDYQIDNVVQKFGSADVETSPFLFSFRVGYRLW
ncbi:MAG: hypothetical protein N4A45_11000 [Flavobacteriales bacterium]|jgi:hypothetical protein|nr:hypothetical protein [Flavobacteriales bacterium]